MKQGDPALAEFRKSIGSLGTPARKAKARARSLESAQSGGVVAPVTDFPINCLDDQRVHLINLAQRKKNEILEIDLLTAQAKLDTELGKLVTREAVAELIGEMESLFASGTSALVDLAAEWVEPDKIIQAQAAFRDRVNAIHTAIANAGKAR